MNVYDAGPPLMLTHPVPALPTGSPSVTVKVCPMTVTVPVRSVSLAFGDAVTVKVPGPVPLEPAVTVSQLEFETMHGHTRQTITRNGM